MGKLIPLFLLFLAVPVYASEKCPCSDEFMAKYECGDDNWVFAEGQDVISLTGTCQEVTWTSETAISCVMGKAGQDCTEYAGGYSGTIVAGKHDLSHLNFCKKDPTSVAIIHFSAHQLSKKIPFLPLCLFVILAVLNIFGLVILGWIAFTKDGPLWLLRR